VPKIEDLKSDNKQRAHQLTALRKTSERKTAEACGEAAC